MDYYVYVYMDPAIQSSNFLDFGINFEPIYIGKGKNNRCNDHWNSILKDKKIPNSLFSSRLSKIKESGAKPIILKIYENLYDDESKDLEKYLISKIGRFILKEGTLLNITEGGDGGVTWIGNSPFKGKTLCEIYGDEKAQYMKNRLSEEASKRIGETNHMYGRKGEKSPIFGEKNGLYGKNHTKETKELISNKIKEINRNLTEYEKKIILEKIKETKSNWTIDTKKDIYKKISDSNKNKIFSAEHKDKLSKNNYNKNNKGKGVIECKEETKKKISEKLKNREFTKEHKDNLRIYNISYEDLKNKVQSENIKSKRLYKIWVREKEIEAPLNPGYKNYKEKWEGWNIFLGKIK